MVFYHVVPLAFHLLSGIESFFWDSSTWYGPPDSSETSTKPSLDSRETKSETAIFGVSHFWQAMELWFSRHLSAS